MRLRITHYTARRNGIEATAFVINSYTEGVPAAPRHMGRQVKMLVVELPTGLKVGISFKHEVFRTLVKGADGVEKWVLKPKFDAKTSDKPFIGITWCEIYRLKGSEAILYASGWSVCKVPDNFVKRLGRIRALTHVLDKRHPAIGNSVGPRLFCRDDRTAIWNAYWHYVESSPTSAAPATLPPPPTPPGADVLGNALLN